MKIKMKFVCGLNEDSSEENMFFYAEGKTFLHALGLIDEQILSLFGSSMLDNDSVTELSALLYAYETGEKEYYRTDFSTPESNWTLYWEEVGT